MNYDAVALGEYLIDFTPQGLSDAGQPVFERNPGGAPVNVVAAMAKLGMKTGFIGKVDSYSVHTIDTTGAGDGFLGAFLYQVLMLGKPLQAWSEGELCSALRFANAAGALATTRKGAIPSLGTIGEIDALMRAGNV